MILLPELHQLEPEKKRKIASLLIGWFREHKRDLPWRGAAPYAVWVSEIMLQQTQVATVIPYFNRFLTRFPKVEALAAAQIDEVLHFWAGLGYYARARNLHRAAQIVVESHSGCIPKEPAELLSLPGIGRYTAGAILSIAYDLPQPILDGNVIRVLSRLFGVKGDPTSSENQKILWGLASELVPAESPGDFNQGLMELGAILCEPAEPKCERCPLLADCFAGNSLEPNALPETPPGRKTVKITQTSGILLNDRGEALLVQRPLHGLWGGLWEFPRASLLSGELPSEAAVRALKEFADQNVLAFGSVGTVAHSVTHHRITLHGVLLKPQFDSRPISLSFHTAYAWIQPVELNRFALSAPQIVLTNHLIEHLATSDSAQTSILF